MRKQLLCGFLTLLLLCAACTQPPASEPAEGAYTLYFVSTENRTDGAALASELFSLPQGTEEAEGLLRLLLGGPEDPELRSPFPAGTSLRGWSIQEGTAYVDLSEAYGGLSGVDLTLADGCVVLTLCQLEEVEAVYLTVEGRPRPFRDQVLVPADFLLDNALVEEEPQETESFPEDGEDPAVQETPEET